MEYPFLRALTSSVCLCDGNVLNIFANLLPNASGSDSEAVPAAVTAVAVNSPAPYPPAPCTCLIFPPSPVVAKITFCCCK